MEVQAAADALLKNAEFMEIFQRALEGSEIPTDDADGSIREKWLKEMQEKIAREAKSEQVKNLEHVQEDEHGKWMWIMPNAGLCIKCHTKGGMKVFINICSHERIAEPMPIAQQRSRAPQGAAAEDDVPLQFRVPLSCSTARPEKDKEGRACKAYDVVVNPLTVKRCSVEPEFRRFVAALCMQWIQQKHEPTLNVDEFTNVKMKAKGTLEPQRIRLALTAPAASPENGVSGEAINVPPSADEAAGAIGDEIKLPANPNAACLPTHIGGISGTGGKLVEEVAPPVSAESTLSAETVASVECLEPFGQYDWTGHVKPAANPYFRDAVPAGYHVHILLPSTVTSIKEVDVAVTRRQLKLRYVDEVTDGDDDSGHTCASARADAAAEDRPALLRVDFDFPVDDQVVSATYIRRKRLLKLQLAVKLPNEGDSSELTKPSRDAEEEEVEEQRRVEQLQEKDLAAWKTKQDQRAKEEALVMSERKKMVENLAALGEGTVPPALRDELTALSNEELVAMLHRLEARVKRGDSIDEMLDRLPDPVLAAVCNLIRDRVGLARREAPAAHGTSTVSQPPQPESEANSVPDTSAPQVEYNNARRSEKLFGIAFENRYLFALDL